MSNYLSVEFIAIKSQDRKLKFEDKLYNSYVYKNSYKLKIFIIIIILLLYKFSFFKRNKIQKKYSLYGNYSLYNYFKYPQISIIISYNGKWTTGNKIFKLLTNLQNQTLNNIEIIIASSNFEFEENKKLKNLCLLDKRIKLKKTKRKDPIVNLFSLMSLIKGKFVLILNKYFNFKKNNLEKFYNFTKGKIKNIFKFKINREPLFLIKTKILRDINDNDNIIYFKNISNLVEYITSLPDTQLNYISVSLSTNNYYTPLAYVCMTSILYSKYDFTYISFYILISKEYHQKNIDFLKSLYDEYDYFNITILKIDNRYDKAFISRYLTKETYFRCSLGELIPYLNKIIYLDTDVIVFKDLTNLYNLNFNDKMILGQSVHFEKNSGYYRINPGIMLLNLKKMREINMEKKILNIVINKKEKYNLHDQAIINKYFKQYLGVYPPEYHARPYNENQTIQFNNISGSLYNIEHFLFSWKYPTIKHYYGKYKPSKQGINNNIIEDWWYFARLSKYFVKKTNNYNKIFKYSRLN